MNIILNIIVFYIHLIFALAPYMISGVAVYFYCQYQQWKKYDEAVDLYAEQFGVSKEDAVKAIYYEPFV